MTEIIVCDWCGTQTDVGPVAYIQNKSTMIDLCDDCMKRVMALGNRIRTEKDEHDQI